MSTDNNANAANTKSTEAAPPEDGGLKKIIFNGLLRKNPILVSGMVIAPVVVLANNIKTAFAMVICFSIITFFTLLISSFVPKSIVYTIRIILYTLIGGLVYVPAVILLKYLMPDGVAAVGVFFPMFITSNLIITRSESIFFLETKGKMILDIIFCIIGYDIAVLIFAALREIIGSGTIGGNMTGMPVVFRAFENPFGGFILLGLCAALFRSVMLFAKKVNQKN